MKNDIKNVKRVIIDVLCLTALCIAIVVLIKYIDKDSEVEEIESVIYSKDTVLKADNKTISVRDISEHVVVKSTEQQIVEQLQYEQPETASEEELKQLISDTAQQYVIDANITYSEKNFMSSDEYFITGYIENSTMNIAACANTDTGQMYIESVGSIYGSDVPALIGLDMLDSDEEYVGDILSNCGIYGIVYILGESDGIVEVQNEDVEYRLNTLTGELIFE